MCLGIYCQILTKFLLVNYGGLLLCCFLAGTCMVWRFLGILLMWGE